MYANPKTFDDANLANINLGDGDYLPIIRKFCYLGSVISGDCTDTLDVHTRIEKAGKVFGALSESLFRSMAVSYLAKSFVFRKLV